MTAEDFQTKSAALLEYGVAREQYHTNLAILYTQIVIRPFPSGAIITELVSKSFPTFPQKVIYHLSQELKLLCAEQDLPPSPAHGNN